jgi:nucleoside-diphosphate-sugar epimerase
VLLTGATGFVGSHVAEAFVTAGWSVRCTVRPTSDTRWIEGLPVELTVASVERGEQMAAAVKGSDVVVHLAGVTRARTSSDYMRVNAEGTERLAVVAAEAGIRRFVLVSSLAARGPDPASDTRGAERPTSAYGRSKLEGERLLVRIAEASSGSMEAVVLRPGGVYGPRDRDLLPLFRLARRGWVPVPPGEGRLQPVHVSDVASAVLRSSGTPSPGSGPYPVAAEDVATWSEVAAGLARSVGRRVRAVRIPPLVYEAAGAVVEATAGLMGKAPEFDRRRARDLARLSWTCDPGETMRRLDWAPAVPLAEGLERTAEWYREQGWLKP